MEKFFEEFGFVLKKAIIEDYKVLLGFCNSEKPYSCALVTDSDASTLFFAMNTEEKLKEKLSTVQDKYKAYYTWTPAEWVYGDQLSDKKCIANVSGILYRKTEGKEIKENMQSFEIGLYETMTSTLKSLINEGYFSGMTVFISISDDNRSRNVENYSAQLLNSEAVYNNFIKRFENKME
jgi:hypothetical protein